MASVELMLICGFLGVGGFTFLRLIAGVRQAAVTHAEGAALARQQAEQDRREAESSIPIVKGAV